MPDGKYGPLDTHELIRQAYELFNRWIEDQRSYLDTALSILTVVEKGLLLLEKAPIQLLNLSKDIKAAEVKRYVGTARQEIQRVQKLIRAGQAAMESLGHQDPEAAIKVLDHFIDDLSRRALNAKSATVRAAVQAEADAAQGLRDLLQLISVTFKGQSAT